MSSSLHKHVRASWNMWLYGILMVVTFLMPQLLIMLMHGSMARASFEDSDRYCDGTLIVWAFVAIMMSGDFYFFWCSFWFVVVRRFTLQGRPGAAWIDNLFKALILLMMLSYGLLLWHADRRQGQMDKDCEPSAAR
jgi:hypothetical protein